jgi:UDP-N-acetyl-2-amino-2-deoxyglucuronate dehydrogenase
MVSEITQAKDDFRFVIVGTGSISGVYLRAIEKLPGVSVVAMVSRSGRRPEYLPESIPVFTALALVTAPFDAVILGTPNGTHAAWAIEAATLGKHVLTEKVLEISVPAMDAMSRACTDAGVKLAVTYQRRMSPDNHSLKTLLDSGRLGKVFSVDVRAKFYRDDAYYKSGDYRGKYAVDGGGPFMQQAPHNIDLLCWFFGMPEKVVSMLGTFAHDIEVEDHGVALLRYANGMIATITASTATKPGFPAVIEIHTEKGSIVTQNDKIVLWAIDGEPNPSRAGSFAVHSGSSTAAVNDTAGHEAIIADFVEAVRTGRDPVAPAASARLATELALRIYQANVT